MASILAIYSAEDNEGMMFAEEVVDEAEASQEEKDSPSPGDGLHRSAEGLAGAVLYLDEAQALAIFHDQVDLAAATMKVACQQFQSPGL